MTKEFKVVQLWIFTCESQEDSSVVISPRFVKLRPEDKVERPDVGIHFKKHQPRRVERCKTKQKELWREGGPLGVRH